MNKPKTKKFLLIVVPVSMLIGGLITSMYLLYDTNKKLTAAEETLVYKEDLNSDLMEDLLEARNQLYMIDMYNEREFYMDEEGE